MVARAGDDDASMAELPWASVFDPAANVRALSAIQARGFRAATEVVDRFVRLTDRGFGAPVGPAEENASEPPVASLAPGGNDSGGYPEIGRLVKSLQNAVSQLGESTLGATKSAEPGLDLGNSAASGEAQLESTEPGPAVTEVWLHNRGSVDLGKVRLRCSDLLSHDGAVIESSRIRFEPDVVPMPDRCSRGVTVEVDVPQDLSPGRYRGTLLADGHADVWLPVVLNIGPRTS
jgi:hypothetical protein